MRGTTLKELCIRERREELLREWHYARNGDLVPDGVAAGSHRRAWWIDRLGHEWQQAVYSRAWWLCPDGHVWRTAISNRTNAKKRTGCPFCAGNVPRRRRPPQTGQERRRA